MESWWTLSALSRAESCAEGETRTTGLDPASHKVCGPTQETAFPPQELIHPNRHEGGVGWDGQRR